MRIPVPKHTLVAMTLLGALLTTVVAGGLMYPSVLPGDDTGATDGTNAVGADAPTPNASFTPAVQTASGGGYEEGEHEDEDHEEDEGEWDD